ncbi:MAG: NFACT RNA binding domain-containing protein [Cytophagaceae bacterium]|nr:NFACT RNA binding domain-containing protein [Cytophagaceae bacterium]
MQTNYYFLRQLTPQLAQRVVGLVLAECFSQEKDELVLGFCPDGKQWRYRRDVYIRATLRGDLAALTFPDEFRRAGKNSVDLFPELLNRPVQAVRQFENERCFALVFDEEWSLLFKLFGNRSNLVLCHGDEVEELFNHKLVGDQNLKPGTLDRPLDQSFGAFERAKGDWKKLFPTFGKEVNRTLETQLAGQSDLAVRWEVIQNMRQKLENPTAYFVKSIDYQPVLSLLPDGGEVLKTLDDPITAANEFYYAYSRSSGIDREKAAALRALTRRIQKTEAYLETTYRKLAELEDAVGHEEVGHILMANLHQIPERAEVVELYDFYRDQPIRIRLKPDATPQKNAEIYYRKARNEKIEVGKHQEAIEAREAERVELERHCRAIEPIETLKELRKYLKANTLEENTKAVETPETLFRKVVIDGFEVFIGRNARNNDLLTTRYARKEDLWLHARDVTGSHVVIRRKPGQPFPNRVIERAAQLAAWHSKRRTDSLCPVIVTPKKFVRKTRDLAEGQVIIDKEEVVMVVPENF